MTAESYNEQTPDFSKQDLPPTKNSATQHSKEIFRPQLIDEIIKRTILIAKFQAAGEFEKCAKQVELRRNQIWIATNGDFLTEHQTQFLITVGEEESIKLT